MKRTILPFALTAWNAFQLRKLAVQPITKERMKEVSSFAAYA